MTLDFTAFVAEATADAAVVGLVLKGSQAHDLKRCSLGVAPGRGDAETDDGSLLGTPVDLGELIPQSRRG